MPDFDNYQDVNALLGEAQKAESDNREKVREVTHFLKKPDGQWEPEIVTRMTGRPRYTFDKCNPVVDSIAGEMEQAEFGMKVRPAGGEATTDLAKVMDGMIRNIQSMSDAKHIFNASGRKMVESGFDAWRVTQEWADTDSFEQDLFIRKIANAVDRVWFDTGAEMQNMADAKWVFVLQALTKQEYEEKYPDGSGKSVSDDRTSEVYYYKPNFVVVGEFLWKEEVEKELVLMSNNAVYEDNEDFQKVVDELAAKGITEVRRRKRKGHRVKTRMFDGGDWLGDAKDTVFDLLPIIPTYGNFDISENKVIYRGAVEKLIDPQRVYNYAQSRAVEEGALAPRAKFWMTLAQAEGVKDSLQTLNTNADPVQFYKHVDGQPAPYTTGGAQINPGLQLTSNDMKNNIIEASGIFSANKGDAPKQSGYAIELQQDKGDTSTIKYFSSQEIAINHTVRVVVNAIPKVYDTKRTVRILGEDGTSKMEEINSQIMDEESGEMVELNDVRKGKYDVVSDIGPAFKNRQQETARAFLEAAGLDPSLLQEAGDIWLKNLNVPGFDQIAERKRKRLFEGGAIPDSQMTDDEKVRAQEIIEQARAEQAQAAAQGPTVMEQAVIEQTKAGTADVMSRAMQRNAKIEQDSRKLGLDEAKFAHQMDQDFKDSVMDFQKSMADNLNTQADTLTKLVDALGAQGLVGPHTIQAGVNQAEVVVDTQEKQEAVR